MFGFVITPQVFENAQHFDRQKGFLQSRRFVRFQIIQDDPDNLRVRMDLIIYIC